MSALAESVQQPDSSSLKDALAKHAEKMMELKLSQLKKRAKAKGIPEEAIEVAAGSADDEDDAKSILISLILKAACVKATPSPAKNASPRKNDLHSQMCLQCPGCIRPPKHEGPCMDGQCNDIIPEPPKEETGLDVAVEMARHKVVKEEVLRKVEETARHDAVATMQAQRKAAEEEASRIAAEQEAEKTKKAAEAEAQLKADEEAWRLALEEEAEACRQAAEKEALRKAVEEEKARQEAAEANEARRKALEEEAAKNLEEEARTIRMEEARARRQAEEDAEMAEMDERCVETFLECVCRERVRTPIKGSKLYTLHIRPARPAGTSVDVKDSSFRNLGFYLKFLEDEGLLRLKPGLSDPVVTEIRFDACRTYTYKPRPQASPVEKAPLVSGKAQMLAFQ